jgi:hypothetical protein
VKQVTELYPAAGVKVALELLKNSHIKHLPKKQQLSLVSFLFGLASLIC